MSKISRIIVLSEEREPLLYLLGHFDAVAGFSWSDWIRDEVAGISLSGITAICDYLDRDALYAELDKAMWRRPLQATVLVYGDDDDCWRLILSDGAKFDEVSLPLSEVIGDSLIRRPKADASSHRLPESVTIWRKNGRWEVIFSYAPDGAMARFDIATASMEDARRQVLMQLRGIGGKDVAVRWKEPVSPDRMVGFVMF
jgi:hypothetical protein